MKDKTINIVGCTEVEQDVQRQIKKVGAKGLSIEQLNEKGVISRLSTLLCTIHCTMLAAYNIYGHVDCLMDEIGIRRHEIKQEMNAFEKAYDRFISYWTNFYSKGVTNLEISSEAEILYKQIMHWAEVPIEWNLGDAQRKPSKGDYAMRVALGGDRDSVLMFKKTSIDNEYLEEKESWAVLKHDKNTNEQVSVNTDLDKASALMIAKRLSDEDKEHIYTVALLRDVVEKRTDIIPYKAYKENKAVGDIRKELC